MKTLPAFHFYFPTDNTLLRQDTGLLLIEGSVRADPAWLDAQGLPAWKTLEKQQEKALAISAREEKQDIPPEVLDNQNSNTVRAKGFMVVLNGSPLVTWLGRRTAPDKAIWWAEAAKSGLGQGTHRLAISLTGGIQASWINFGVMFSPEPDLPPPLGEIVRDPFVPPPMPEPSAEQRERQRRLEALLEYVRRLGNSDWGLVPPIPGLNEFPEILKGPCKEKHDRLRRLKRLKQLLEDAIRHDFDEITVDGQHFDRQQMRDRRWDLGAEIRTLEDEVWRCMQRCRLRRLCFRFIRLGHPRFPRFTPDAAAEIQNTIDCVNRILLHCGFMMEASTAVETLPLTDEEYRDHLEGNQDLSRYAELFRLLVGRARDKFAGDCINIVLTGHASSLGENTLVHGGTGGLVTGNPGVRGLPRPQRTPPDPLPRHVWMPERWGISCRTLAHEIAHVLGLEDQYGNLGDLFPPDHHDASQQERADESYRKASEWKQGKDEEVRQRMAADQIDEAEARRRIRDGLSEADRRKWDRVYNLMALGSNLSDVDCDNISRHFGRHAEWQRWARSAGQ